MTILSTQAVDMFKYCYYFNAVSSEPYNISVGVSNDYGVGKGRRRPRMDFLRLPPFCSVYPATLLQC